MNWTAPFPVPLLPAVIATQFTGLEAAQAHVEPPDAVTVTLPLDAPTGYEVLPDKV